MMLKKQIFKIIHTVSKIPPNVGEINHSPRFNQYSETIFVLEHSNSKITL